jgi:hypothetical protein
MIVGAQRTREIENMKLLTIPIEVNTECIAQGVLDMFTDEERTVLRFGMLPAPKMESLKRALTNKFTQYGSRISPENPDLYASSIRGKYTEWSMRRAIGEAMHEITVEILKRGDLVV